MTTRTAQEDAAQTPAESATALEPDALESATGAATDPASTARPSPAFRRFSAARERTSPSSQEAEREIGGRAAPDDSPEAASSEPPRPVPPQPAPIAIASPVQAPPPPPLLPRVDPEPDPERVAAALRRVEESNAFRPSPPRDEQAELDASVGCAEWFDRRPLARAAPAPAPAPAVAPPTPRPAGPDPDPAPAPPSYRAPPSAPSGPAPVPPELGGGDVGAGSDRLAALLVYLLLIVGPPTAGLGLAAAFLLARRLAEGSSDWLSTHYRFQVRTAAIGLVAGVAGVLLLFVDYVGVLAAPFLVLLVGWIVLRAALGLHHLFLGRPHPNYRSWLV